MITHRNIKILALFENIGRTAGAGVLPFINNKENIITSHKPQNFPTPIE
jgi:hypothetical protein